MKAVERILLGETMTNKDIFEREALPQLEALSQFAFQLCGDRQKSLDLVQETMLKACAHFEQYQPGTNCRAWLFRICKNVYINMYRRRQLEPVLVDFQDEDPDHHEAGGPAGPPVVPRDDADVKALDDVLDDDIMDALGALPVEYHTTIILSDFEGYTYEEIAAFTRVPVGTVRSRLHRARKTVWRLLRNRAQEHKSPVLASAA